MRKFLKLKSLFKDEHLLEVFSKTLSAFVVKLFGALLVFMFNVLLARQLGPEGAGIFFLSFTIITVAAVFARFGLDNSVIRFMASSIHDKDYTSAKGIFFNSIWICLSGSALVSLIIYVAVERMYVFSWINETLFLSIKLMLPAVAAVALINVIASALKGLKRTKESVALISFFNPFFSLLIFLSIGSSYGLQGVVVSWMVGSVLTLVIAGYLWYRFAPWWKFSEGYFSIRTLLESSIPLFWMSIVQILITWSGIIFLGMFSNSTEVGLYGAANRTALLTGFLLLAANSIAAPKFAALYKNGEKESLEKTAKFTAFMLTIIASPVLVFFVFQPQLVLSLFGEEFREAASSLVVLSIGQFYSVAIGSVGFLLMMTGHEREMRNILFFSFFVNIAMNLILIPELGALGAALASTVGLIFQNTMAAILVNKNLGIVMVPFSYLLSKKNNLDRN